MSVLVMAMTTEANTKRRETVLNTWGKEIDVLFYSDHLGEKTIKVSDQSDYLSGVEKQVSILSKIKNGEIYYNNINALDYQWILFVDDDTFVLTKNLDKFIKSADENVVYGHLWKTLYADGEYYLPKFREAGVVMASFSGGAGMLVSVKNIQKIKDFSIPSGIRHGDVAAYIIFKKNNLLTAGSKYFNPFHFLDKRLRGFNLDLDITYHYMTENLSKALYEVI